jgi:hypothetical protein
VKSVTRGNAGQDASLPDSGAMPVMAGDDAFGDGGSSRPGGQERRSPGAGGSLHAGDDPPCPQTRKYGNLCVRGDLNTHSSDTSPDR